MCLVRCFDFSIYTHFEEFVVADLIFAYKLGSFYFYDAENGKILQSYTHSGDLLAVDLTNAYKFEDISFFLKGFIRRSSRSMLQNRREAYNFKNICSLWNGFIRRSEGVLRRIARLCIISFFLQLIVRRFAKRLRRISSLRIK